MKVPFSDMGKSKKEQISTRGDNKKDSHPITEQEGCEFSIIQMHRNKQVVPLKERQTGKNPHTAK